jgi:hypothetical protein
VGIFKENILCSDFLNRVSSRFISLQYNRSQKDVEVINLPLEQVTKDHRGCRRIALLLNLGARWRWMARATHRPLYPPKRPATQRLGGPQGRSGLVWKISPPSGFDHPTVQPVASRYIDQPTNFNLGRPAMSDISTRNCSRYSSCIQWWYEAMTKPLLNLSLEPGGSKLGYTHL